jgi:hypothetical protein
MHGARVRVNLNRDKLGTVINDDRADWCEVWALFPGDVIYCWHAGRYASTVQGSLEAAGFEQRARCSSSLIEIPVYGKLFFFPQQTSAADRPAHKHP